MAHHLARLDTHTSSRRRLTSARWYPHCRAKESTRLRTMLLLPASCTHSRITATDLSNTAALKVLGKVSDRMSLTPRCWPPAEKGWHAKPHIRAAGSECNLWTCFRTSGLPMSPVTTGMSGCISWKAWVNGRHQSTAQTVLIPAWLKPMVPIPKPAHSSIRFHMSPRVHRRWHKTSSMLWTSNTGIGDLQIRRPFRTEMAWHSDGMSNSPKNRTLPPSGHSFASTEPSETEITSATTLATPPIGVL